MARRARDKLINRAGTHNSTLDGHRRLQNHVLLIDDDLRETAHALGGIEDFLVRALHVLDQENLESDQVQALATDTAVQREMEYLGDTLSSLKRRLHIIATTLDRY
jgi:hypothetical protein